MIRLFSMIGAIAILGSTSLAMPQPASAKEQCHPAYDDVCVPAALSGRHSWTIPVEKGFKTQALCIKLGSWTGENPIVIEWDGRYAARKIKAKGHTNAVMVRVKQGKQPGYLRVYSPGSSSIEHEWSTCNTGMASNIENLTWGQ
jgi:hypothetical protein